MSNIYFYDGYFLFLSRNFLAILVDFFACS